MYIIEGWEACWEGNVGGGRLRERVGRDKEEEG